MVFKWLVEKYDYFDWATTMIDPGVASDFFFG
jgi:hypothetical protein